MKPGDLVKKTWNVGDVSWHGLILSEACQTNGGLTYYDVLVEKNGCRRWNVLWTSGTRQIIWGSEIEVISEVG